MERACIDNLRQVPGVDVVVAGQCQFEAEVSHGFLPVTVTAVPVLDAEPMAEPFAPPLPSALSQRVLISPAGYRLEGLTLDDVVHVLRELS